MSKRPRIIFMGTPDFAVPIFTALADHHELGEVVAAVTQPDKPAGRGRRLQASPIKREAEVLGIPVLQPTKMKKPETQAALAALAPDLAVVAAYGRILPPALLAVPRLGCVNVHASILPKHRGASPITYSLLAGDTETGVTIMQMDEGMDTGPIYRAGALPVAPDDTCGSLSAKLAALGAALLIETLPGVLDGTCAPVPQNDDEATSTKLLQKDHGRLVFERDAVDLERRVRAMHPWPMAYAYKGDHRIQILAAAIADGIGEPGRVIDTGANGVVVACGRGALRLLEVKPAGKKAIPAAAWVAGRGISVGDRFN